MKPFFTARRLLCALAFSGLLPWAVAGDLPPVQAASKGMLPERLARIRPVIQAEIDAKRMPGVKALWFTPRWWACKTLQVANRSSVTVCFVHIR